MRLKMTEVILNKKEVVEVEFEDRARPELLVADLSARGVDSYVYTEHPLYGKYRAHVEAKDAMAEVKKSAANLESDWKKFAEPFGKKTTKK